MSSRWQIWIDRGGTFTDCVGLDPKSGRTSIAKVLSGDDAPLRGIRALLGLSDEAPIPVCDVRMGTTLATNALLERRGVPTALVITRGFGDLLAIGDQRRPELFDLEIKRPSMLYREVLEVDARLDASGEVLTRPDTEALRGELRAVFERGLRSVAIVLTHAYKNPSLERELGQLARDVGFEQVSLSHEADDEIGMLARADTSVVDAYLTPLVSDYLKSIAAELPGSSLRIMQSSGALTDAARFRGRDAILSGPAGGVVALGEIAKEIALGPVIGFDMGGTSTDVSRYAGEFDRVYETMVAGVRLRTPMMKIHTVAAGGGSICRYESGRFQVGPQSAGARPGPLCYGHEDASALTLTDVNLVLGRLHDARFGFALRPERAIACLEDMCAELARDGREMSPTQVAAAFFELAIDNMAQAIRAVSVARGYDVRDHALVVFGGAGGQFAIPLACRLGMRKIVFHPLGGVLSAWGMGVAELGWHGEADAGTVEPDAAWERRAHESFETLATRGIEALSSQGLSPEQCRAEHRVDLRYQGTQAGLQIAFGSAAAMRSDFEQAHRREFGYARPKHPIEAVTLRTEVRGGHHLAHRPRLATPSSIPTYGARDLWTRRGVSSDVPVIAGEALRSAGGREDGPASAAAIHGPCMILEQAGTIVLDPGWSLRVDDHGTMICEVGESKPELEDVRTRTQNTEPGQGPDPLLLEVFSNRFMSIAEQMGESLRRTAQSTNIRDRLDFSCAVFDPHGGLVANAPHIPVHLGAMSESVQAVLRAHPRHSPGDVYVTNDPSFGGSHLPDITVVTPVHDEGGTLRFFTASRGHHADIGGISPGSMPPFSRRLSEEGVIFSADRIVRAGTFDREGVLDRLRSGPHPARNPEENLANLRAQIAANQRGAALLLELAQTDGLDNVLAYMQHVQKDAAARVQDAIKALPPGERSFTDALDDGTPIAVKLSTHGNGQMTIDFAGTGAQLDSNLNAPRAVTVAAVLYVLRALVGRPIPLNSGCLEPIVLRIPPRSLLSPNPDRAVAGGNVETSQRIVDVLLGALGEVAASQGTMNNLTFGAETWGYYETIGGGAGAGRGFHGASGVHTHMTNTRITDPGILEARFPVRLEQFALRPDSGGAGRWRGGLGLVRELTFLERVRVSIISERRSRAPFGLAGGAPGAKGQNLAGEQKIEAKAELELGPGESIRIETPGGGGFGSPA